MNPESAQIFNDVQVTPGENRQVPEVKFPTPLNITDPAVKLLRQGEGDEVQSGQQVSLRGVTFNAADGTQLGETFSASAGQTQTVDDSLKSQSAEVYEAFSSAKVGAYIGIANPSSPSMQQGASPDPATLSIYFVESVSNLPSVAPSDEVASLDSEGKLPTVNFDDNNVPSVNIPSGPAPENLVVKVLKEGDGDALAATDTINANYAGWRWEDSSKFDSSYDRGEPASFGLSQVIPGWTQGLTGQKVGSTVLLVIPSALGYGDNPGTGRPAGPLVFVVEIVGKS
ncbi:FKBP-type peptidyl-prolyl cis-trans isomerase [Acaricomes phytoseiuli]|uniref:FKBP-type peptidyl-prolyl cis-trans isomerase n=1 Tax=Acaricomes phytoseiuli TaxID=291968 RepID=UPI002223896F|nr:FKBP-type peptidyl-prolyl cis-trans isomerase [Acaricomes phytoseiuli]MCW1248763.1 FKBP-type peptidyl-prolyl cis-trans isomerase [Acaricomes phytoseiuli]